VSDLHSKGAIFIENLADVPTGNIVIFSAHGVSLAVREEAKERGLRVFDATCPLVAKVHVEITKMRHEGREVVMIGHKGHPEVEGTMGQTTGGVYLVETVNDVFKLKVKHPDMVSYVSQTTLSIDDTNGIIRALKEKFPAIVGPKKSDICYATTNRQQSVKFVASQVDLIIVVGSPNSSNSNRLREAAESRGTPAYMVDRVEQIDPSWFQFRYRIGVTAGASAPEVLVQAVVSQLRVYGAKSISTLDGIKESTVFSMLKELR
jgi:4-hydroxy-3-methylbut-2-enyl diphosphate reductase